MGLNWFLPTSGATLVGDVRVEAHASIWYNAVLRADFGPIIIREGANVQDSCVLHRAHRVPGAASGCLHSGSTTSPCTGWLVQ